MEPGYCMCGCGQATPLADRTWAKYGMRRGEPLRFVKGHNTRGRPLTTHPWAKIRPIDRFLKKVEIITESGCWIWMGALSDKGYAIIRMNKEQWLGHRFSYEQLVGPIPRGMNIIHSCDIRCCVNPAHVRPGTHQDNMDDMSKRNRANPRRGETNNKAKISNADAAAIRVSAESNSSLAERYGIAQCTVRRIKRRETWAHV